MKNIRQTTAVVKEMLEQFSDTRDNDNYLYYEVCNTLNPDVLKKPFGEVLSFMSGFGIPPFESVTRARRKVQSKYPELAGSEIARKERSEREIEIRKYAKEIL